MSWNCSIISNFFIHTIQRKEQLMETLKEVDVSNIVELDDNTDLSGELACAGGACEIQ